MGVSVHLEPSEMRGFSAEHCCFCRAPTRFWVRNSDSDTIAVCPACAERSNTCDLPSKTEWMRRERIAVGN